jgi:hypothetical protein
MHSISNSESNPTDREHQRVITMWVNGLANEVPRAVIDAAISASLNLGGALLALKEAAPGCSPTPHRERVGHALSRLRRVLAR